MAAEVSSRQIKSETKSNLITRDFLGGCFGIESKELDLDLHVPTGWEKRLDLKSGKVYIQRCNPANSTSNQMNFANQSSPKFRDLNSLPHSSSSSSSNLIPTLNLLEEPSLDLKLVSNSPPSSYTSVCTLDKVKSALERAERSSVPSPSPSSPSKKRWMSSIGRSQLKSSSSPSNSSSLSAMEMEDEEQSFPSDQNGGLLVATACPVCLFYVLIFKTNPKCPRCKSVVKLPVNVMIKKPKIDLNMSM